MSHFIPKSRNLAEEIKLPADVRKSWLKATLNEIKNLINNQTFLMDDPRNEYPVTRFIDVNKSNIKSDGSIDKLKLRIGLRGDLKNKEMIGYTWAPTSSMRTLKYFLAYASKKTNCTSIGFYWIIYTVQCKA